MRLNAGTMAFTYCQVPVIYRLNSKDAIEVTDTNGNSSKYNGYSLDAQTSNKLFIRSGEIVKVIVDVNQSKLK